MGISPLGSKIKNWTVFSSFSTPDYFNVCANAVAVPPYICTVPYNFRGYQYPRTGNGYLGNYLYGVINPTDSAFIETECVSVKLKQPLIKGRCYYGEFFISLGDNSEIATNQIGMLFTKTPYFTTLGTFTNTIKPQIQWDTTQCFTDTLNWVKVSGKFLSTDDEEYLTLGSYRDGLHLKKTFINSNFVSTIPNMSKNNFYIYFDDIALYEIPKPQLGVDIETCSEADSLQIGDTSLFGNEFKWYANGILIDTLHKQIKVKPNSTTTYVLQNGGCASDTLIISYLNECNYEYTEPIIPNVFTPNNDSINDVWRFSLGKGNRLKTLSIYNRWGNNLTTALSKGEGVGQKHNMVIWDGRTTSGIACESGVYFYVIEFTDSKGDVHRKNGYITLIK